MKVVSPEEMVRIERLAYAAGASEAHFMDRAGEGVAHYVEEFIRHHRRQEQVLLLCGKGNNAGDALVAGRLLLQKGVEVTALFCCALDTCSPLCKDNAHRFQQAGGFIHAYRPGTAPQFPSNGVIIDGLFGTGFKGALKEPFSSLIREANASGLPILAVDIPSGLDGTTGSVSGEVIRAAETFFLGLPKTGFFLDQGWNHVGKLRHVDFGLPEASLQAAKPDLQLLGMSEWRALLPPIRPDRNKYQRGYVVGLGGSPGMPGAAIMAAYAALRSGAGIVKLLHPEGMQAELASCPVEVIRVPYRYSDPTSIVQLLNAASANFLGPGIGKTAEARKLLGQVLSAMTKPYVLDADGLTLQAEENWALPANGILTPHRGEMARLLGLKETPPSNQKLLQDCQRFVETNRCTLVLKGGPTFILHPGQVIQVSTRGDPGMATAGMGDVLTGVLAALIAQGLQPFEAASLGVSLHSMAGEQAARVKTSYAMVASDVLAALPQAFSSLLQS